MKASSILLALAAVLAVGVSFCAGCRFGRRGNSEPAGRPDTVTITKWVAAPIPEPVTTHVLPKLYLLPVHDTTAVHDTTHTTDSVLVEVPISEKTYVGENYRATIVGYNAELTDIWVMQREKVVSIPYRKHLGITLGPQLGVGFTPKGIQPYAGFGATFGYSF